MTDVLAKKIGAGSSNSTNCELWTNKAIL